MTRALAAPVLLLLLAAGCVAPAGTDVDPQAATAAPAAGWWERAVPSTLTDPAHVHADRSQHTGLTTPNFQVLGWDPLVTSHYGTTLEGMGCGGTTTREDGRRLAIVHSISTDVSFVVADVTDPAAPMMVGEFYMPNAVVWDADISADGHHVLVGAYPYAIFGSLVPELPVPPVAPHAPLRIQYRDACGDGIFRDLAGPEAYLPYGPGIVMVGIADPSAPVLEDWVPQPAIGPHSVGSQMIDGKVYATASVTNFAQEASYYSVFEIVGPKLVPTWTIQAPGHPGIPLFTWSNGHVDVFLHKHPATGQLLAHLANWDGYYIYDLVAPGVAIEIAAWFDDQSVHTTFPFQFDDKTYVLVGQEVGEPVDLPTGWIYILDITDPAAPVELGRWTMPVKVPWADSESDETGLLFSPHYVAVLNKTIFVSNYHGGLWAVDISDPSAPAAIGIFVPDRASPSPYGGEDAVPAKIEDVIVDPETGLLTTWDNGGGVYVLRFDETMPKVPAPRWPGSEPRGA